jgi:hypothetical protein
VIWEPFILALVLGIIVSAGLYFAYLWQEPPQAPLQDGNEVASETPPAPGSLAPSPPSPATEPASPAS